MQGYRVAIVQGPTKKGKRVMPFGWQGNAPFSSKKKNVKVINECGENMKRELKKKNM